MQGKYLQILESGLGNNLMFKSGMDIPHCVRWFPQIHCFLFHLSKFFIFCPNIHSLSIFIQFKLDGDLNCYFSGKRLD